MLRAEAAVFGVLRISLESLRSRSADMLSPHSARANSSKSKVVTPKMRAAFCSASPGSSSRWTWPDDVIKAGCSERRLFLSVELWKAILGDRRTKPLGTRSDPLTLRSWMSANHSATLSSLRSASTFATVERVQLIPNRLAVRASASWEIPRASRTSLNLPPKLSAGIFRQI